MTVIGMGESKTPTAFVKACEEFKLLDVLYKKHSFGFYIERYRQEPFAEIR